MAARFGGGILADRPHCLGTGPVPGTGGVQRAGLRFGEGRWTVHAAVDEGVPASVITTALYQRFESRDLGDFTDKVLSAMRSEFGGHAEKK